MKEKKMRTRLVIVALLMAIVSGSVALAEEKATRASSSSDRGRMMWSAMVGAGLLHEHMKSMIQQMAGITRMMSEMIASGKMDEGKMKIMSEIMAEMSDMMDEIPAVQDMMDKVPGTAMKNMSRMTKTMSEIMDRIADMMSVIQQ
jgi:hypothetical protein